MNLQTIPRAAVGGYLKALRWPLDRGLGLVGQNGASELRLDRAEASVRSVAGVALGDNALRADAARRHAAADEREHAQRLRAEADERREQTDEQLAERQAQAERQRHDAARRSDERRARTEERRETEHRRLSQAERRRQAESHNAAAKHQDALNTRAGQARLKQLDQEADALSAREQALTAEDEAQRLHRAASQVKATRKR